MKVVRFEDSFGSVCYGVPAEPGKARLIRGDISGEHSVSDQVVPVRRVLPPIAPPNIIAIGLNYRRHAEEGGKAIPAEPLVFVKLTTSVIADGEPIVLPASAPDEVDWEGELAVIIGKPARKVSQANALDYVLGYACANDVSARDCQIRRDAQWARAKGFDTFCPLGPCLLIDKNIDPNNLRIQTRVSGELMQDSNTSDMIFPVRHLVSYLSHQFTLLPGTVIVTGTPEGVGVARKPPRFLRAGDRVSVEIEAIGRLENPVQRDTV